MNCQEAHEKWQEIGMNVAPDEETHQQRVEILLAFRECGCQRCDWKMGYTWTEALDTCGFMASNAQMNYRWWKPRTHYVRDIPLEDYVRRYRDLYQAILLGKKNETGEI